MISRDSIESIIENIDGDPVSALSYYVGGKRTGAILRTLSFTILSHLALGSLGAVDIPYGSSSAFGISHARFIRQQTWERKGENKDDSLILSYYHQG